MQCADTIGPAFQKSLDRESTAWNRTDFLSGFMDKGRGSIQQQAPTATAVPPACSPCSRRAQEPLPSAPSPKRILQAAQQTLFIRITYSRDTGRKTQVWKVNQESHFHFKMPDGYPSLELTRHNVENRKINRAISKKSKIPFKKNPSKTNQNPTYSSTLDLLQEYLQWKLIHASCAWKSATDYV